MSDRDFYDLTHDGVRMVLPRVTSILKVLDKSGPLMGWATRVERDAIRAALEDVLTAPGVELAPQSLWDHMDKILKGKRAWVKSMSDAADIGHAAHDIIRWNTLKTLGQSDLGPEPGGPDAALRAVDAWMDWCRQVDFVPIHAERLVYCPSCGYAGTTDCYGKVEGQLTVVDYKTGKAIYPEAEIQVNAYAHALRREGLAVDRCMILRLPKTAADPQFEAMQARDIPINAFRAVCMTWRLKRWLEGDERGSVTMKACEVGS